MFSFPLTWTLLTLHCSQHVTRVPPVTGREAAQAEQEAAQAYRARRAAEAAAVSEASGSETTPEAPTGGSARGDVQATHVGGDDEATAPPAPPVLGQGQEVPQSAPREAGDMPGRGTGARAAPRTPPRPHYMRCRAQFGRKRTHNEQILVCPCGFIVSRATFFNAEAISSLAVRLLHL